MFLCKNTGCEHNLFHEFGVFACQRVEDGREDISINENGECDQRLAYCRAERDYRHDFYIRVEHKYYTDETVNPTFVYKKLMHGGKMFALMAKLVFYTVDDLRKQEDEIYLYEERTGLRIRICDYERCFGMDADAAYRYFTEILSKRMPVAELRDLPEGISI